jgi:SAM-dependent methyltransferase
LTDRTEITDRVERYYSSKVADHGPTARGVDWNSRESQQLRFAKLLQILSREANISVNDYGCGYGALIEALDAHGAPFTYQGFDLSAAMVAEAEQLFGDRTGVSFTTSAAELGPADYTLASGIFNVRFDVDDETWHRYVLETVEAMTALSGRGVAFNMLTGYSDREHMRSDLYYADPTVYFDYCVRRFPRRVALLHDYDLYEFTILIRLDPAAQAGSAGREEER